jgi:hypothetical protein
LRREHSILFCPTQGNASVYRVSDGTRILRFTNFTTSNGPDVHIYMVANEEPKDNASVGNAGYVDLGVMKGNIGDHNYNLDPNIDLSKYRAVVVWCKQHARILFYR